ncbi:MAG: protein kinase [Deltaproteobacteria bacterium]|nr:protein kinase [Deltaproteobacteria bacterium]
MSRSIRPPLLQKGFILNGKWEILSHIATGGKGEVYRAKQLNLDREVAIKIISPEFIESLEEDEEELKAEMGRFKREVLAMAQARHPNVLQVYDYDNAEFQGHQFEYIAMEYIPGSTLRLTMPAEGLGHNEKEMSEWIAKYFFPVLDGVEAIHNLGMVHRDLKPENVLLDGDSPKISDFGLAGGKFWEPITRSHHALGTIIYMAPEQFSDMGLTDARADVYALGKILFEATAGKMGKGTTFPLQTVSLADPSTPILKQLDQIIQQATAKNPNDRLPSVKELRRALERLLNQLELATAGHADILLENSKPKKIKNLFPLGLAGIMAVLLFAGVYYHFKGQSNRTITESAPKSQMTAPSDQPSVHVADSSQLPKAPGSQYLGRDGASLRFVPGGKFLLKDGAGKGADKLVFTASFFMDENEVTNQQYVDFLNKQLSKIKTEEKVVSGEGGIWLYLGEIKEGYEPILYREGSFIVNGPQHTACPVVRVTAYGAEAYARFYGRTLPTVSEWLHAATARHAETEKSVTVSFGKADQPEGSMSSMDSHMERPGTPIPPKLVDITPSPVGQTPPNEYGIIGLDANISEWAVESMGNIGKVRYLIIGGVEGGLAAPSSRAIERNPWEAFGTVGFRTIFRVD